MTRPAGSLWATLRHAWLRACTERPADPRLAADALMTPAAAPRTLSPLVEAWLR